MDARRAFADLPPGATLPRHRFTVADVFAMQEAGVIQDGQVELLGGELVTMAAKKNDHEIAKRRLVRWLTASLPDELAVAVEATLYLSDTDAPEPDIMVHADALLPEDVRGSDLDLVIEVSVESLAQDLGAKASLYARHGVACYWVVDPVRRQVHVHQGPLAQTGRWQQLTIFQATDPIALASSDARVTLDALLR